MEKPSFSNSRRGFLKKTSMSGLGLGMILTNNVSASTIMTNSTLKDNSSGSKATSKIIITDLRCAVIGNSPVVRITTNVGISGYSQAEVAKYYLKPYVLFFKDYLMGEDPTNVEKVMLKIRRLGSFKPWGAAISIIEMALWDIAGKAVGLPVYKLLGGKIRDKVRVYNGAVAIQKELKTPEDYGEAMEYIKSRKEGFTIVKQALGFHSRMPELFPEFYYGDPKPDVTTIQLPNGQTIQSKNTPYSNRGVLTEKGFKHIIACVDAMKKVLGDEIGLALDIGPNFALSDAIRLAKALEPYNLLWIEDMITGDYNPYVMADLYKELTMSTTTPIHTGEQIYLRQHFRELIEKRAVSVIGPDPADMGGIAELKWVAEYADLHSIQMAPHAKLDGLIGLAALVQVSSTLPENYIAFEYPIGNPEWWYDIVEGLPDPIVKNGHIEVWDRPGLGVNIIPKAAKKYLADEDKGFFD